MASFKKPPKDTEPPGPATIMVWEGMTVEVGAKIWQHACYYIAAAAINFVWPATSLRRVFTDPAPSRGEDDEDFEDDEDEWEDNERELAPCRWLFRTCRPW